MMELTSNIDVMNATSWHFDPASADEAKRQRVNNVWRMDPLRIEARAEAQNAPTDNLETL